jgi:ribokinase
MLDPAPAHMLPSKVFHHLRWFTPNETEAAFFVSQFAKDPRVREPEQIASALLDAGVESVVLKMGSRGVYLASANTSHTVPAFQVEALDTTAAGDAFNGAFATALTMGMEQMEAARFAAAAAAISVTRPGAQPSMPTRAEVDELLRSHR